MKEKDTGFVKSCISVKKLTCFNFNVFRSRFVLERKNLGFFLVLKKVS